LALLKIDLDLKPSKQLLLKWIETRKLILRYLKLTPTSMKITESNKGLHIFIRVKEKLSPKKLAETQFLLGDDHLRSSLNLWRSNSKLFTEFNVLFDHKKVIKHESKQ